MKQSNIAVLLVLVGFTFAFAGCEKVNLNKGFIYGRPVYKGGAPVRDKAMKYSVIISGEGDINGSKDHVHEYSADWNFCRFSGSLKGVVTQDSSFIDARTGFQDWFETKSHQSYFESISQNCYFFGSDRISHRKINLKFVRTLRFEASLKTDPQICEEFCDSKLKSECRLKREESATPGAVRVPMSEDELWHCVRETVLECERQCVGTKDLVAVSEYYSDAENDMTVLDQAQKNGEPESSNLKIGRTKDGNVKYRVDFVFDLPK